MAAIKEIECDLTVLGHYTNIAPGVEPVTSGHWDDISYDALTDTTTFTDFGAAFPAAAVNWWLQPLAARSTYLPILGVAFSQIIVAGNALNLASGPMPFELGSFYTIVWPMGVDPHTADNSCCSRVYDPRTARWTTPDPAASPRQNGFAESFHARLRDELLEQELFGSVQEAKLLSRRWSWEYIQERPHSALGYGTPAEYAAEQPTLIATGT